MVNTDPSAVSAKCASSACSPSYEQTPWPGRTTAQGHYGPPPLCSLCMRRRAQGAEGAPWQLSKKSGNGEELVSETDHELLQRAVNTTAGSINAFSGPNFSKKDGIVTELYNPSTTKLFSRQRPIKCKTNFTDLSDF